QAVLGVRHGQRDPRRRAKPHPHPGQGSPRGGADVAEHVPRAGLRGPRRGAGGGEGRRQREARRQARGEAADHAVELRSVRGDHREGWSPNAAGGRRRPELPDDLSPDHLSRVPLARPSRVGRGAEYVADVAASGLLGGGGRYTAMCAERLGERLGSPLVLLTPSCSAALELSVLLAELGPGDEAIVPSFTHPATAAAVAKTGAIPVFADIAPETLGLDPSTVAAAVTDRTRAIMPTHYAGVACDMAGLSTLAERHRLAVIEDAAHGVFADLEGRPLGSLGDAGCFSFGQ